MYRPIRSVADRLNNRPAGHETVDPQLRGRLRAELDDDVRRLEVLIGRDLSAVWW